jgi:hypothetical protein
MPAGDISASLDQNVKQTLSNTASSPITFNNQSGGSSLFGSGLFSSSSSASGIPWTLIIIAVIVLAAIFFLARR